MRERLSAAFSLQHMQTLKVSCDILPPDELRAVPRTSEFDAEARIKQTAGRKRQLTLPSTNAILRTSSALQWRADRPLMPQR